MNPQTKASCLKCGSHRIVPGVPLVDRFGDMGHYSGPTQVAVHGEPEAWFFKDTSRGALTANICGDCGHVELYVSNHRELYEKYRASLE
jgi:hypothetical protein